MTARHDHTHGAWAGPLEAHRDMPDHELVEIFISDLGVAGSFDEAMHRDAVHGASTWLEEIAAPGAWERFDPGSYRRCIGFLRPYYAVGHFLVLTGFIGWMGLSGLMDDLEAARIIRDIGAHAPPDANLREFCANTAALLEGRR